ncbi:hypothetical protein C8J57DRAFT_68229 [Mycena rebaudengoi]|nr:hypothetical protein C8J57DRAFT_68229 [Mycena rebaudengoi]
MVGGNLTAPRLRPQGSRIGRQWRRSGLMGGGYLISILTNPFPPSYSPNPVRLLATLRVALLVLLSVALAPPFLPLVSISLPPIHLLTYSPQIPPHPPSLRPPRARTPCMRGCSRGSSTAPRRRSACTAWRSRARRRARTSACGLDPARRRGLLELSSTHTLPADWASPSPPTAPSTRPRRTPCPTRPSPHHPSNPTTRTARRRRTPRTPARPRAPRRTPQMPVPFRIRSMPFIRAPRPTRAPNRRRRRSGGVTAPC